MIHHTQRFVVGTVMRNNVGGTTEIAVSKGRRDLFDKKRTAVESCRYRASGAKENKVLVHRKWLIKRVWLTGHIVIYSYSRYQAHVLTNSLSKLQRVALVISDTK